MFFKITHLAVTVVVVVFAVSVRNVQATPAGVGVAMSLAKIAFESLVSIRDGYSQELRMKRESETVKIRIWMHNGDPRRHGCGFYFHAAGYAGPEASSYFPSFLQQYCYDSCPKSSSYEAKAYLDHTKEDECYQKYFRMFRMTTQSTMYEKTLHLGNQQASSIEFLTDGYEKSLVNMICIGLNERTIAGGPRSFCINSKLLESCLDIKQSNEINDLEFEGNMCFSRAKGSIFKLKFTHIDNLINSFDKFNKNSSDSDALRSLCDSIYIGPGYSENYNGGCRSYGGPTYPMKCGVNCRKKIALLIFPYNDCENEPLDIQAENLGPWHIRQHYCTNGILQSPYGCKRPEPIVIE